MRLQRHGAHVPVVVIDEFQQLVNEGGITAERQLRSVIQTHRHVSYVFAGSKTRLLIDMTSDHARPFYKLGQMESAGRVAKVLLIMCEQPSLCREPSA
jgi:hypothetical protein